MNALDEPTVTITLELQVLDHILLEETESEN